MIKTIVKFGILLLSTASVFAAVYALLSNIQVPSIPLSFLASALSVPLAVASHWIPAFSVIFPAALTLLSLKYSLLLVKYSLMAVKYFIKIFKGAS